MSDFILSLSTVIVADESLAPVRSAANILRRDMRQVLTGRAEENRVVVVIDPAIGEERFVANVAAEAITLRCGNDLGAVYALLSVSERLLGVKPLGWWMGMDPAPMETARAVAGSSWSSPEYAVRWRGWFANDEVLFTGWHMAEPDRAAVWRRLFETVLRCGGNMVIPGTDRAFDGDLLCEMALDMGLWITQHHTELLGAKMFGRVYPDLQPSYPLYPEKFEALWRESLGRWAGRRVVWAIGFRGQGDCPFWASDPQFDTDEKRGAFISAVMRRQMELAQEYDPNACFATNLYGEMMVLYRKGLLDVPEGVVKVWGDNGFGRMVSRRQNNRNPRADAMPAADDAGPHGIYYHVSFYDLQAANHITMLQNPPQAIAGELKRVLERSADAYWNINVGSVKPHIFMLELVRRMWTDGQCDADDLARQFARDYYGGEAAAPLLLRYAECAVRYGPNDDDRAGDQYYHFPLRTLAHKLLRGETAAPAQSLLWAADAPDLAGQARLLAAVVEPGIQAWADYARACRQTADALPEDAAQRLRDTLLMQATLHQTGCEGLYDFCQALQHAVNGDELQAYLWTDAALRCERAGLSAMREAAHGRFAHIYDNDCFAGVALTVQVLESVRAWLRVRGDGELLYDWEKRFLVLPEENRSSLQTHRTVQLSDDELCLRLRGEAPRRRAF